MSVVIIPVKSFRGGNQRLARALDDSRREMLGKAMAEHTATAVADAGLIPLVVTADAQVVEWATVTGFPSLPDPGDGLNAAAGSGVEWAIASGSPWIVLHSDLPLITGPDVSAIAEVVSEGRPVLAPSSDGGTSAIGSEGSFRFGFGTASFHRHLSRLPQARVVIRTGLTLDIDAPDDLAAAIGTARGAWLRPVVS